MVQEYSYDPSRKGAVVPTCAASPMRIGRFRFPSVRWIALFQRHRPQGRMGARQDALMKLSALERKTHARQSPSQLAERLQLIKTYVADRHLPGSPVFLSVERDLLPFAQHLRSCPFEGCGMNEHVLASVVGLDKSKASLQIVKLYSTCLHRLPFVKIDLSLQELSVRSMRFQWLLLIQPKRIA